MSSLIHHGFGRIVVVVDQQAYQHTQDTIWPAVLHLLNTASTAEENWEERLEQAMAIENGSNIHNDETPTSIPPLCIIQSTQINLIALDTARNVPKQTLVALERVLFPERGNTASANATVVEIDPEEKSRRRRLRRDNEYAWLGTSREEHPYKYLYLTEPDTLLMTKPYALEQFKSLLDQGRVLSPHRLQPIPHEYDLMMKDETIGGKKLRLDPNPTLYVPAVGNWSRVIDMDPVDTICCDGGLDSVAHLRHEKCGGSVWWQCGFGTRATFDKRNATFRHQLNNATLRNQELVHGHRRFLDYQFVRFREGSRIIHLAGGGHGRQCRPQAAVDGPCRKD
eukprot:CAMPEP_0119027730 /NCGR_PEP_ID=MMETSP1176-20130426/37644_1 /TAXON_ID=265551 /ORGANISM="Synedropsis recta cf, Strain CCMP1620" /LENGTH=337 /DNA_ID=CAMNT_0006983711 /DNA_START=111 /DNA_END=1124 /DNA_ORIENTATION=-